MITAINGNTLVLDAPLTDSFDPVYLGNPPGTISRYAFPGRIARGRCRTSAHPGARGITEVYGGVTIRAVKDAWISDVIGEETQNAFNASTDTKRITFDHVINSVSVAQTRTAATGDFSPTGSQILLNWCQSNGSGDWAVVTGAVGTGPIVILNSGGTQTSGISPHQRWTTGILSDSVSFARATSGKQGISYKNRTTNGSGHGWTTGWSVAWNAITPYVLVSQAPGSLNWCIGCKGSIVSEANPGIYDSQNVLVTPDSLYLQQLRERLGDQALAAINAQPFNISSSPATRSTPAGSATSYTVSYSPRIFSLTGSGSNGVLPGRTFNGSTTFSVTGLPPGATASFSPASLSAAGNTTLTVTPSGTTAPTDYALNITASNPHYVTGNAVSLTVTPPPPGFTLAATPASQTVVRGSPASYTVTSTATGGFTGNVALSVSGLPTGATATFSPTAIAGGSGTATLNVTTTSSTATGTKTLTITGTSSSLTRTTTVTLVVNAPAAPVSYEAEATGNTFGGTAAAGTCSGCSGGKRVRFIGSNASNSLTINKIASTTAGTRTLAIYPVVSGTRSFSISVNGGAAKTFTVSGTTWNGPTSPVTTSVTLQAGSNNTVKIFNNTANAPDMDRVTVQ